MKVMIVTGPEQERFELSFQCDVRREISLVPVSATLQDARPGETVKGLFHLMIASDADIKLLGIRTAHPWAEFQEGLRSVTKDQDGNSLDAIPIDVLFRKDIPFGSHVVPFTVITDHPVRREFEGFVHAEFLGPVEAMPKTLRLGTVPAGVLQHCTLTLRDKNGGQLQVSNLRIQGDHIHIQSWAQESSDSELQLSFDLLIAGENPEGDVAVLAEFKTEGGNGVLRIPLRYYVDKEG